MRHTGKTSDISRPLSILYLCLSLEMVFAGLVATAHIVFLDHVAPGVLRDILSVGGVYFVYVLIGLNGASVLSAVTVAIYGRTDRLFALMSVPITGLQTFVLYKVCIGHHDEMISILASAVAAGLGLLFLLQLVHMDRKDRKDRPSD